MSTSTQSVFDFPGFARTLTDFPRYRLSEEVEKEIIEFSGEWAEDVVQLLRRRAYKVELQRLHTFLQTGESPEDMTPQEEEAYETLLDSSVWMD